MRNAQLKFGRQRFNPLLQFSQVTHTRTDHKALPAAKVLAHQRFTDHDAIPGHDEAADRQTVNRRGRD